MMNRLIFYCSLLVLLAGCSEDFTSSKLHPQHRYHVVYTTIIEYQCFICQQAPTIAHTRQINEKEFITVHYCEKHLANYILEND